MVNKSQLWEIKTRSRCWKNYSKSLTRMFEFSRQKSTVKHKKCKKWWILTIKIWVIWISRPFFCLLFISQKVREITSWQINRNQKSAGNSNYPNFLHLFCFRFAFILVFDDVIVGKQTSVLGNMFSSCKMMRCTIDKSIICVRTQHLTCFLFLYRQ